jgi:hypothetical protein
MMMNHRVWWLRLAEAGENTQRRDGERRREKQTLGLMGLRGVKLVICIAHDQDTCHVLNGGLQ